MVRPVPLVTIALLLAAASCNRRADEDRAKTAAVQRSVREPSDEAHNDTMDKAGAPQNDAAALDGLRKEGNSP